MDERNRRKLAELADKYELIRQELTPDGLWLIAKYRRDHKPWWRRLAHTIANMITKRVHP